MTTALVELMGGKYHIPPYQRGYRWEEQEVTELLDDLWHFCQDKESGDFYCLQPIVLQQKEDDSFDVLDGQQRLTTLYLLLVYLEDKRNEDGYNQPLFSLNYETRGKCEDFLANKKFTNNEIDESNIDFYHICKAYQYINTWFQEEKHRGAKSKLIPILLDATPKNKREQNKNVRVIKYVVEKGTNPIDVFIRLNVGKIPLTDAELTKALLLQSDKYSAEELKYNKMRLYNIATEWDAIENELQNENFWYFLNNNANEKPTHIEFIFDIIAENIFKEKKYFKEKPSKHATFLLFSKYLEDLIYNEIEEKQLSRIEAVEKIWRQTTAYFDYFKEWFQDRTLYHYIGFILAVQENKEKKTIDSLIAISKQKSKTKFIEYLEEEIAKLIKVNQPLEQLVYENEEHKGGNDKAAIAKILFIHNVYSTLQSKKEMAHFPFKLYKEEKKWSLEHIYAQNSESITHRDKQNSWLDDHMKSLSNHPDFETLVQRIASIRYSQKIEQEEFDDVVNEVYVSLNNKSQPTKSSTHSISNLCLLDSKTNSTLNNSVFDVKREKIKKQELKGLYIPICTRNVFLKAYTEYPKDNFYWREEDRSAYIESIQKVYNYFTTKNKDE